MDNDDFDFPKHPLIQFGVMLDEMEEELETKKSPSDSYGYTIHCYYLGRELIEPKACVRRVSTAITREFLSIQDARLHALGTIREMREAPIHLKPTDPSMGNSGNSDVYVDPSAIIRWEVDYWRY